MSPRINLALLIVAYRSAEKLEKCLYAAETHFPHHSVYLWDNSGTSYTDVCNVAQQHQKVKYFTTSENIGFAAAVNRLAAMVPHRDMLLINPDAEVLSDLDVTRTLLRSPNVAASAPMVWDVETTRRSARLLSPASLPWDVAHRRSGWLNAVGMKAFRPERLRGTFLSDRYRTKPTIVSGYLTGACLAIRSEAWEAVGPFDEEFFLYGEESDWQRRAVAAGWKLCLADEIGVLHSGHGTVAGDPSASRRSQDLLRAAEALRLEYRYNSRVVADAFLVVASLIDAAKQRLGILLAEKQTSDVIVAIDTSSETSSAECIRAAKGLDRAGYKVTVISLGRLGRLPRELPTSIHLVRRPWWWPSAVPNRTPSVLVTGDSLKQKAFQRLFCLRRKRTCVSPTPSIEVQIDSLCTQAGHSRRRT